MWQFPNNSLKSALMAFGSAALLALSACTTQPTAVEPAPMPEPVAPVTPMPPATQPQPVMPEPAPVGAQYHTVSRGETLYSVGRLYNVHPRDLASWNNIKNYNSYKVKVGEKLRVSPP
jgi:LysM repeat protein